MTDADAAVVDAILALPDQFFCFEGETMVAEAGDVYEFDNTATHWVENRSNCERITMIVCIRAGV